MTDWDTLRLERAAAKRARKRRRDAGHRISCSFGRLLSKVQRMRVAEGRPLGTRFVVQGWVPTP